MDNISVQINPCDVLGVEPDAPLIAIRDAYHAKAKLYHPDVGGEEWAFRILAQAYETMSRARVVRASRLDAATGRPAEPSRRAANESRPQSERPSWSSRSAAPPPRDDPNETIRAGAKESTREPERIVDVERLLIRFEVEDFWLLQDGARDDRFLSCSLNLAWPDAAAFPAGKTPPRAAETLHDLEVVFENLRLNSAPVGAQRNVEAGGFSAWLSYASPDAAWKSFRMLRDALHERGLTVKQWTRDVIIPKTWRSEGSETSETET